VVFGVVTVVMERSFIGVVGGLVPTTNAVRLRRRPVRPHPGDHLVLLTTLS
jgi:hypothetical protein